MGQELVMGGQVRFDGCIFTYSRSKNSNTITIYSSLKRFIDCYPVFYFVSKIGKASFCIQRKIFPGQFSPKFRKNTTHKVNTKNKLKRKKKRKCSHHSISTKTTKQKSICSVRLSQLPTKNYRNIYNLDNYSNLHNLLR